MTQTEMMVVLCSIVAWLFFNAVIYSSAPRGFKMAKTMAWSGALYVAMALFFVWIL